MKDTAATIDKWTKIFKALGIYALEKYLDGLSFSSLVLMLGSLFDIESLFMILLMSLMRG